MIVVDRVDFSLHSSFPVSVSVRLVEGQFVGGYLGGIQFEMSSKFLKVPWKAPNPVRSPK